MDPDDARPVPGDLPREPASVVGSDAAPADGSEQTGGHHVEDPPGSDAIGDGSGSAHGDDGRAPLPPDPDDEPPLLPADPDDEPPPPSPDPDDEPPPPSPDPDDGRPLEERAAGQMGPGITRRQGIDPTLLTAAIFVLLGFTPVAWWQTILGFGFFGPLEVPAILAMVGVLFAFIAVLRAVDTDDVPLRTQALIAAAAGLLRLFVVPFF